MDPTDSLYNIIQNLNIDITQELEEIHQHCIFRIQLGLESIEDNDNEDEIIFDANIKKDFMDRIHSKLKANPKWTNIMTFSYQEFYFSDIENNEKILYQDDNGTRYLYQLIEPYQKILYYPGTAFDLRVVLEYDHYMRLENLDIDNSSHTERIKCYQYEHKNTWVFEIKEIEYIESPPIYVSDDYVPLIYPKQYEVSVFLRNLKNRTNTFRDIHSGLLKIKDLINMVEPIPDNVQITE